MQPEMKAQVRTMGTRQRKCRSSDMNMSKTRRWCLPAIRRTRQSVDQRTTARPMNVRESDSEIHRNCTSPQISTLAAAALRRCRCGKIDERIERSEADEYEIFQILSRRLLPKHSLEQQFLRI